MILLFDKMGSMRNLPISLKRIDAIRPCCLTLIIRKGKNHCKWGDHTWNNKGKVRFNLRESETSVKSAFMALDTPWKSMILLVVKIPWEIGY